MSLSHWSNRSAQMAYERAYDASLGLWPVPCERRMIETPFGATHVVVSGDPDGEPLVFVHAASLSATQWYLQAAAFARDHRLYAVDIMGDIGSSTQTAAIHTRVDAAAWLAALADGLGLQRATYVGSSFGGFQSTNLAVHRPDLVGGLVLLAPAATLRPFRLMADLVIRMGSLVPLPVSVKPGLRGMMQGDLPDPRIVRQMEVGVAGFRYDRHGIYPSEIPDGELATVACATLVILGDREMIYDPTEAAERAQRLLPDVEVEVMSDVGHLLGMQRPEVVNGRIRAFLDTRVRSGQPA